jgi:hypothetical protein
MMLALALASLIAPAYCYGSGVKAYVPTMRSADADTLPFLYNGSFIVYNDGYRDGVYIIRVGVTEPTSINWLNLSDSAFTLRPGQSKLVQFTFNVSAEQARPGEHEFIFTPTLLATSVEPYLNEFANYISSADSFRFRLNVTGIEPASSEGTPIVFVPGNRTNFVQYSVLQDTNNVVTQLDRAIKLNLPEKAVVGENVPVTTSIFEGLSKRGISLLVVSPEGPVYPISEGNFTFNSIGLWGVIVMVGDEMIIGKAVDVTAVQSPLSGIDAGTVLAGLSLLVLLSVVPIWLMAPGMTKKEDPYDDIIYKAYIIKKYVDRFDKDRLQRAVQMLWDEYSELVAQGARGKKDKALADINELNTLAFME